MAKLDNKKEITKKSSGNKKGTNNRNLFVKFRIFCNGVKDETLKVHWTSKSDVLKYSVATIVFVVFCSGFFYLINVVFALLQSLIK